MRRNSSRDNLMINKKRTAARQDWTKNRRESGAYTQYVSIPALSMQGQVLRRFLVQTWPQMDVGSKDVNATHETV